MRKTIKKNIFAPSTTGRGATRRAAMLLVMMLTTVTAWAQTTITPTTPSQDDDGYYLIGNAAELYGFAGLVNNGNATANAKLTADIVVNENVLDANGEAKTGDFVQWTPIGNNTAKAYSGTFDGQGHTISGLYVSGSSGFVGLIGTSGSATIKNLGIVDSYFSSSGDRLGSIVGNANTQSSVTLANVYSTSTVKGVNFIGGLVGGDGFGSVTIINSYFAGKTSAGWSYGNHHDDLVSGDFLGSDSGTPNIVNTFVVGTSLYGTTVTAEQLSDGTVAAALHYYQDALADGSMFGMSGGKTNFSGTIDGVSIPTANITLHTFTGDTKTYSSKYVVGNTTPLPVNVACEGYNKFAGWYNNANLVGNAITSISSSETGDKEFWAKYKQSHTVTFELDGGLIEGGEIDHYIEGEVTPLPAVVRKGDASFEGWYTTPDCSGERYVAIPATATEDMTFYAKWGEAKTSFYLMQTMQGLEPVSILYEGENIVWLDKTTLQSYKIFNNEQKYWGSGNTITVPYVGGEYAFSNNSGSNFRVNQSGFYVFTLTDKGDGNWFVSVLKSMLNCDVASIPTQTYTGSAIEPVVTVKDGETTLTLGTDYEVAYSNNVNAGTATVTITGKGNYSGETAATFTIVKSMTNDGITIAAIADQTYTGSAIEPAVTVKDGETTLALGTDYTIGYSANVNVGTATATITGMGNYSGSREATFTIVYPTVTTSYVDASGTLHENVVAIPLINAMTTLPAGTYVVNSDVDYTSGITTTGDVKLILGDGCTMSFGKQGEPLDGTIIECQSHNLTIYGQSEGTGWLKAYRDQDDGIHVNNYTQYSGNVLIFDGNGACIDANNSVTLLGGTLDVESGGVGGGDISGGSISILGGKLWARHNGLWGPQGITLGYTNATDQIYVNIYQAGGMGLEIADGKTLVNDYGEIWSGALYNNQIEHGINNRTLKPVMGVTLTKDGNNVSATFDGTSTTTMSIPVDVNVTSVTYNRAFTMDKPSTVMLPFSKDVGEIGGGTFYTFGGVEKKNNKWVATMNVVTGSLTKNTPYLFVPAGTSLTFTGGATLNTTGGGNCLASDTEGWEFHGTYTNKVWDEVETHDYGFALVSGKSADGKDVEEGQFVRLTTGASAKPMRCYLSYVGVPNQARAMTRGAAATDEELPSSIIVRLVGANGETTAIGTIDTKTGEMTFDSEAWYTLDGVRLSGKPTKKGLYINNGKKVVIK